jgi:hypothetical protein
MERLICSKEVGDFQVGDVMPYTDPIDITILTTLGVAKIEQAPVEGIKKIWADKELIYDASSDRFERPEPPRDPRDPDEDDDDEELKMETPDPLHPTPPPSPTNPPNQPPSESVIEEGIELPSRRGMKAEHGARPKSPGEYHTRVMNEERTHDKKRRTRTPK